MNSRIGRLAIRSLSCLACVPAPPLLEPPLSRDSIRAVKQGSTTQEQVLKWFCEPTSYSWLPTPAAAVSASG